ncbi:ABC transporter permease [Sediminivirga luteola]|uniref:ABC transporter permease n=2 Tax=Sediminivirga luteola TaxID=1774748 RepID=A0A8J2XJE1_9MICO|nr:ABC transporter permease [Sediminivirga luteola]
MKPRPVTMAIGIVFGLLVAAYLIVPTLTVIPMAFSTSRFLEFPPPGYSTEWLTRFFQDSSWTDALVRSLVVAGSAAAIATPLGTLAAYAIVTAARRANRLAEPILMMPMMVPVVISGFGLYLVTLLLRTPGNLGVVVLAHAGLAIPFVVITVTASLRSFDFRLVRAARVHGASAAGAFFRVVLPVIGPGVGAGALMALMVSLDEPVVSMFIAGDTAPTLPVRMFGSITYELNPLVPVAASVLTVVTLTLLVGSLLLTRLTRRRTAV